MWYLKALFGLMFGSFIFIYPVFAQEKKAPPPPPGGFPEDQGIPRNSQTPDFKIQSIKGKEIELSDYRGQYVLIDFWGTWCQPCLEAIPYLKEAYSKYGDEIKFISVAADNDKQAVIDYVRKNDMKWTQIVVPLSFENPAKIIDKYNVRLYPSVFLIDPNGVVQNGAGSRKEKFKLRKENLLKTLKKVLNQQPK